MKFTPSPQPAKESSRPQPDPIGADLRRARRTRKLPEGAACALCGETNPIVLDQGKRPKSLLEVHHVAGWTNDPDLVVALCLNCHMKATFEQHDVGIFVAGDLSSQLELIPLMLRSIACFFELLVETLYRCADVIDAAIKIFDQHIPEWRMLFGMP
jgi:hypothetical protein